MRGAEQGKPISRLREMIALFAGILLIIPLTPFLCQYIPPIRFGRFNLDLLLAFAVSFLLVRLLFVFIKPWLLPVLGIFCGLLLFNQFENNGYDFTNIANEYSVFVKKTWTGREKKAADALNLTPELFEDAGSRLSRRVRSKIQTQDSVVRNFSVRHSLENFGEYENKFGMLTRYFSLFKYINLHFKYVPDPQRDDYFATPRETILNGLGGDCDDHSILMASCLMSIGATCRLVVIQGHMYPEIFAGDHREFLKMQEAIVRLFSDQPVHRIYYHEYQGQYWVNLDYTAHYPGGPYLGNQIKLLIDL